MWIAIITFIINLITKFFSQASDVVGAVWSTGKEIGSAIATSVVDWFKDDDVSATKKVAAVVGAGYVLAPDATSSIVSRVGDGIADVTTTVVDTTDSFFDRIFSSKYSLLWIAAGGYLIYKLMDD